MRCTSMRCKPVRYIHACKMHTHEMYPHEMHAREVYAREVHAHETHTRKVLGKISRSRLARRTRDLRLIGRPSDKASSWAPRSIPDEEEKEEEEEINMAGLELPEDTTETVPNSPERSSTPPQRKRTHTLVSRTPTKPATPPRPPPPRASTPIEDPYELPASTAPARLAPDGRSRRERVQTERATIARRAGWLPKEQARE